MSYIGIDPEININRFKETNPIESYPDSVLKEIKLLSFSRNKLASVFGSYIYRVQKYPGDIDLVEEYTECCNANDVINKFIKSLKKIVKNIQEKRIHYLSEVKVGLDYRYHVYLGEINNGIYNINKKLNEISNNLYNKGLLSEEENKIIQYIYNLGKTNLLSSDQYDTINYIFRERRILRWTSNEILRGEKILPGNEIIYLKHALRFQTPVKIDLLTIINGKFVEITNFLQLAYLKNGLLHFINIDLSKTNYIPVELPKEIEKLYFSNMHYSPFKMVKRMYSLGRHNNDDNLLHKIIPFISSNTSLLYQIKSEIDTIILILQRSNSYPDKLIKDSLNDNKIRISRVLELSKEELIYINKLINDINKTDIRSYKIYKLKYLKKIINHYINMETITYLNKVGLNPPPYKYLPPHHIYNYNMTRSIHDDPENPFIKYKNLINKQSYGGYDVYYPSKSHHYADFFEDPNSKAILSKKIISNPGLNEIPSEDLFRRELINERLKELQKDRISQELNLGGASDKTLNAWWSAFIRSYRKNNNNNYPYISFEDFKKIVQNENKYDYKKFISKLPSNLNVHYLNPFENLLNRCEKRTDRLLDYITKNPQQVREIIQESYARPNIKPPDIEKIITTKGPLPPPPMPKPKEEYKTPLQPDLISQVREASRKLLQKKGHLEEIENTIAVPGSRNLTAEGNIGGYAYSHNFKIPLFVNENLKIPKILENEMRFHPQTASSSTSDYYWRGYGPSLKAVNIPNAPLVINGQVKSYHQAGCENCKNLY